jgi:hypothetical protein
MTYDLAITCTIVAAPIIGLYAVARQRDNLRARLALVTDKLVDANGRALRAEARLDEIHDQHVEAGKMAHEAERTKRAETTRALALSIGRPDLAERINDPLDDTGRGVAPVSTSARAGFGSSAPLSHDPAAAQRAPIEGGTGGTLSPERRTGHERGPLHATRRASDRNAPVAPCRSNHAGYSAPADFTMKGA